MAFRNFRLQILLRVLFLTASLCGVVYLSILLEPHLYASILIAGVIVLYQIYSLVHYVEKSNRDLQRFLEAIEHEDFLQTFPGKGLGSSFDELRNAFNKVIIKFRKTRAEKEENFRYLQTVVQHVGIALIAFQTDGKVQLFNNAAKKLLKLPVLRQLDDLSKIAAELKEVVSNLHSGQRKLLKVHLHDEPMQLAISATEFVMHEQNFTLVSLQDIQSELEEKELEAWQNLIRVLTHEIMNSITPIASLASTLNDLVRALQNLPRETSDDLLEGLKTIERRSQGLLHFVEAYRGLTRIPTPEFQVFQVQPLFQRIAKLLKPDFETKRIHLAIDVVPVNLELNADPELVEQIIINMVKNSLQAMNGKKNGEIELVSRIDDRGKLMIQVVDNGDGISDELIEKIFVPFFTTKEEGSGIGLSLTRQIMRLHNGTVSAQSLPGERTVFTLRF
jgi:nitrogen fixation/metabolism regulation signal transduction histidine kinase